MVYLGSGVGFLIGRCKFVGVGGAPTIFEPLDDGLEREVFYEGGIHVSRRAVRSPFTYKIIWLSYYQRHIVKLVRAKDGVSLGSPCMDILCGISDVGNDGGLFRVLMRRGSSDFDFGSKTLFVSYMTLHLKSIHRTNTFSFPRLALSDARSSPLDRF